MIWSKVVDTFYLGMNVRDLQIAAGSPFGPMMRMDLVLHY